MITGDKMAFIYPLPAIPAAKSGDIRMIPGNQMPAAVYDSGLLRSALAEAGVQNLLSKAQMVGCHFQQLIGIDILNGLFQAHDLRRNKSKSFIRARGTGVGQMLGLTDIDFDIHSLAALSDDHTAVDLFTGSYKHLAAVLGSEQSVGDCRAGLEGDQGTCLAIRDLALERGVTVENGIHDTVSLCIGHKIAAIADQTPGRDHESQAGIIPLQRGHIDQFSLALTQFLDDVAGKLLGHIDDAFLDRFQALSVFIIMINNFRLADGELISFTAHGLDQDGKMHGRRP